MRRSAFVALILASAGLAALAKGVADGDVRVALLVFFPVVHGEGPWAFAGVVLLAAAFAAFAFGGIGRPEPTRLREPQLEETADRAPGKRAGVVLLGPIPIVFGDDPRVVVILVLLTLALVALLVAFWFVRGANGS